MKKESGFNTAINSTRKVGLLAVLVVSAIAAGSYLATNYGFTSEQKQNIADLHRVQELRQAFASEPKQEPAKAPAIEQQAAYAPKANNPADQAAVNAKATELRETILSYTTSNQEQMIIQCTTPDKGVIYWQSGVENYSVNSVAFLRGNIHDEMTVLDDYKAAGYKCEMQYTANILPLNTSISMLYLLSDGAPRTAEAVSNWMQGK